MCFLLTAHSFNQVELLQGMGKYFVTLAKDLGYEPTILALGRRIRCVDPHWLAYHAFSD